MEKRVVKPKTCVCGKEFMPYGTQKFCSPNCQRHAKYERDNKPTPCKRCGDIGPKSKLRHGMCHICEGILRKEHRGEPAKIGGKHWDEEAREARRIAGNKCCICGHSHGRTGIPVDHIIPRRKMEHMGIDPHIQVNLACLCEGDHGIKTAAEGCIFDGDMVGFCIELARMNYPLDRVLPAFHAVGFPEDLLKRIYGGIS